MREQRYERLRPGEIVAEMARCPLVYFPLSPLEWHGPHLPLGTDTLTAYSVALRAAERTGGVVLPPFYWGTERERRPEMLRDIGFKGHEYIVGMDFPANCLKSLYCREELFALLVREMLELLIQQGYYLIVIVNNHGAENHRQVLARLTAEFNSRGTAHIINAFTWVRGRDEEEVVGHADGEETSRVMALHPETVDISTLPPIERKLYNVDWAIVDGSTFDGQPNDDRSVRDDPRVAASAARGDASIERAVEYLVESVARELSSRGLPY